MAATEITKAPAQFTTPDQIAGASQNATNAANASGRDELRIDLGDTAPRATIAPENDTIRDPAAEEAAAYAEQTRQAHANAAAFKDAKKRKFKRGKVRSLLIGSPSSDSKNLKENR